MILQAMERARVLDEHRLAVLGDTLLDLEAARNAGAAYRIGVLAGAHDRAALLGGPQTHLLAAASDVPDLWLRAPV